MRRRHFIRLLGAAAWPIVGNAQQAIPVIGVLGSEGPDVFADRLRAFRQGLNEAGYVEGRTVAIEYRSANGQYDRLPSLAADLVRQQVTVIVALGGIAVALAAKQATTAIPIVFQLGVDPVEFGLVTSLARPGGNLTGAASLNVEVGPKRLELLHEFLPTAAVIALLLNPANPNVENLSRELLLAARMLGLQPHVLYASTEGDFDTAFATLIQLRAQALVIGTDPFFSARSQLLAALALRHAVPAVSQLREFAAAGGLMSYGGDLLDGVRLAGVYTGRILKGEKPADLPVQQSTKIELIINMKTAKTLGLTVPLTLLGRADEVIE